MTKRKRIQAGDESYHILIGDLEEQYLNGDLYAVLKGISLCQRFEKPLPIWLSEATISSFKKLIDGEIHGERGRGKKVLGPDEERERDIVRRTAVLGIRAWQKNCHFWYLLPERALELWHAGKLDDFGNTIEDAFKIAQLCLAGTKAQASPSGMKKAYRDRSIGDEYFPTWAGAVLMGFLDPPGAVLKQMKPELKAFLEKELSRIENPDFKDLLKLF